jgi:hypothetical protein
MYRVAGTGWLRLDGIVRGMRILAFGLALAGMTAGMAGGQTVAHTSLTAPATHPTGCHWTAAEEEWLTPAEKTCYATTPTYDETMAYLKRIAAAAPGQVRILPFGKTGEGRELDIVVVSKDGVFDPASLHAVKRPVVLVQNSIHAGEMDGKDACLALLRDMVLSKTKARLLDAAGDAGKAGAVLVFIPIYNADGHERRSAFNRINQDGPAEMGWRANGTNLNLNRDYMKADAPETRAFLALYNRWNPDFFVDDHVTDGADFQYDVTFSIDDTPAVPEGTRQWVDRVAVPALAGYVNAHGHVALDSYVELVDDKDLGKGLSIYEDEPRFSTGFVSLTGRPAMLIELHMLKDYRTRVTGNYEALVAVMQLVNKDADTLFDLNAAADSAAKKWAGKSYPLAVAWGGKTEPVAFRGYESKRTRSDVSGTDWVEYSHKAKSFTVPRQVGYKVSEAVTAPAAYLVPAQWVQVINRLTLHGVKVLRTTAPYDTEVDTYECSGMTWQDPPFEGRHPTFNGEASHGAGKFGQCKPVKEMRHFPAGSALVRLDQRMAPVAMEWLEPVAPDSALQWGFFDSIFEEKEYGEAYVEERLAREMMAKDPGLRSEFESKLRSDAAFAASPAARLDFFYQRSEWGKANRIGAYPVGRLMTLDGAPEAKPVPAAPRASTTATGQVTQ